MITDTKDILLKLKPGKKLRRVYVLAAPLVIAVYSAIIPKLRMINTLIKADIFKTHLL